MNFEDSLRLSALPLHNICGASQVLCTPTMNFSGAAASAAARAGSMDAATVSGSAHPHDEICPPSQALCTPLISVVECLRHGAPHDEVCPQSQACCAPLMPERLRLSAPPRWRLPTVSGFAHSANVNCETSQALHTPLMNCADSLRLSVPRPCELQNVLGFAHPRDEIVTGSGSLSSFSCTCANVSDSACPHEGIGNSLRLCGTPW